MQGDEAGPGLLLTAFSILYFFADSYRFFSRLFFFFCMFKDMYEYCYFSLTFFTENVGFEQFLKNVDGCWQAHCRQMVRYRKLFLVTVWLESYRVSIDKLYITIPILYTSLTDRQKSINQFKMYIVLPILPLGLVHFISINSRSSLFQGTLVRGYNEITWLV